MEQNKKLDEEIKSEVWGVALDDHNKGDCGAKVVVVIEKDDNNEDGAEGGMLKTENPLPEEFEVSGDVCGAVNGPAVPELENNPASSVDGCESSRNCSVG